MVIVRNVKTMDYYDNLNNVWVTEFRCPICDKLLAKMYSSSIGVQVFTYIPCQHYELKVLGNCCTPFSCCFDESICGKKEKIEELWNTADLIINDGSTYYLYFLKS